MIKKLLNSKDVRQLEEILDKSSNIVCTAHVRPDGDAMGSILGLCHLLNKLGKHAVPLTPDQPPKTLAFLPGFKDNVSFSRYPEYAERLLQEADLVLCCDFNKPSRQDDLAPLVQNSPAMKVLIDHHLDPDNFASLTFSYPGMSSTCELVFRLIAAMGMYDELDEKSATCLCTGLITDTRNFSVNCDNPDIYQVLVALMQKGADKQRIVKEALETKSLWSVKLQAFAISERMEIVSAHKSAVITLSRKDLEDYHYEKGDTEGLVNKPLEIKGMVSSFYLREDPDCIKVSARSVNGFPVSKVCEDLFGGGGHLQAAGGEFKGTLEECREILIKSLPKYDKYLKSPDKIQN